MGSALADCRTAQLLSPISPLASRNQPDTASLPGETLLYPYGSRGSRIIRRASQAPYTRGGSYGRLEICPKQSERAISSPAFLCVQKLQDEQEVEFTVTVKEFATPKDGAMVFFAQADKQTNQHVAPYTPSGWGKSLLAALAECRREINRFPYHEARCKATSLHARRVKSRSSI
jgi:hypothetical protein